MKMHEILCESIDLTKAVPVNLKGNEFLPVSGDLVGSGLQSNVHDSGMGTVIKMAFIDKKHGLNDAAIQTVKMITQNQDNPFFPKIYHARVYQDTSHDQHMLLLVQMEKLIPITNKKIRDAVLSQLQQLGITTVNPRHITNANTKDIVQSTMFNMTDTVDDIVTGHESFAKVFGKSKNPEFIKAMQLVTRGATKLGADLHADNWMVRLTGQGPQIVIIDPFQPTSFRPGKEHYNPDMENDYETDNGVFF